MKFVEIVIFTSQKLESQLICDSIGKWVNRTSIRYGKSRRCRNILESVVLWFASEVLSGLVLLYHTTKQFVSARANLVDGVGILVI